MPPDNTKTLEYIGNKDDQDIFDEIDLEPGEKAMYSDHVRSFIRQEVTNQIAEIPFQEIIGILIQKEKQRQKNNLGDGVVIPKETDYSMIETLRNELKLEIKKMGQNLEEKIDGLDDVVSDLKDNKETILNKMRAKYDEILNKINYEMPNYSNGKKR